MTSDQNQTTEYETPRVPPVTPPVINDNVDPEQAASTPVDGDSDEPGKIPDEVQPGQGDNIEPGKAPDEVNPDGGDFDQPDSTPDETPSQPEQQPMETPPPPD